MTHYARGRLDRSVTVGRLNPLFAILGLLGFVAADLPAALLRSITWDQGTEMARHLTISQSLGAPVYYCDSHSPWLRGSNETTNGLLRD